MSTDDGDMEEMAECGACRAVVPVNSTECSECGVSFTGVSDSNLGECGACGALVPLDSKSCTQCGVVFVADDVIEILGDWLNATGLSVVELFKRFDANKDGVIEASEFKTGLLALNIADLPESQVERLVKALDEDGDGVIDLNELESTFVPPDNEPTKHVGPEEDVSDDGGDSAADESDDQDGSAEEESEDSEEDSEDDADTGDGSGDSDEGDEDEDSDDEDEDSDDDEDEDSDDEDEIPETPLGRMIKNFKDAGYNAQTAFEHMDVNNDGQIDNEELETALNEFGGGVITTEDVEEVMKEVDFDENGSISIEELVSAFGDIFEEEGEAESEESEAESEASSSSDKEFPTSLQKKLMSKKANDVFWPIMHALFGLFMVLWIANGLGVFVNGEGGMIIHSGESFLDADGNMINAGDSTNCDKAQGHDCGNSLTPLSGDGEMSMPAGFYWDGILMTVLGAAGLMGSLYAHLVLMKQWRVRAKGDSGEQDDSTEDDDPSEEKKDDSDDDEVDSTTDEETEDSDSDEEDDDSDDDDTDDEDEEDSDSDEADDDSDDESDDEDEEDSDNDEGEDIDVGSRVGVEIDGEEIFGTIIEFNDENDSVIIEDEETGDEIEAPQESMFLE